VTSSVGLVGGGSVLAGLGGVAGGGRHSESGVVGRNWKDSKVS
jgi:hypothetical protein